MIVDDDIPSVWRLLWSPVAMAWWARYRTVGALRIGTAAAGLWLGGFMGWAVATFDEPFGASAASIFTTGLVVCGVCVSVIHGWTWLVKPPAVDQQSGLAVLAGVSLAAVPALLIDLPDAILSLYRDAAYYATLDSSNPVWPPLPAGVEAMTNTCMWTYLALWWWGVLAVVTYKKLHSLPGMDPRDVCGACNYDLRGTTASGGTHCPECGAAIPRADNATD